MEQHVERSEMGQGRRKGFQAADHGKRTRNPYRNSREIDADATTPNATAKADTFSFCAPPAPRGHEK